MPELRIKRKKQLFAPANCCFHIYIDGNKRTTLSNGDKGTLNLDPGKHILQINNSYFKGKKIELNVGQKEKKEVQTYSRPILGWLYLIAPIALIIVSILKIFHVSMHPLVYTASLIPLFLFIILALVLGGLKEAIVVRLK